MAEVILMPRLSDTMTEGVIAAWHKKVGDAVKKGDLLAEVETDKATMELESYKDGVLLHVGSDKGGKLQVNDLLAIIGTADPADPPRYRRGRHRLPQPLPLRDIYRRSPPEPKPLVVSGQVSAGKLAMPPSGSCRMPGPGLGPSSPCTRGEHRRRLRHYG